MRNILFFFSNTLVGGAETNIVKIASELKLKGFNVFFVSFENNGPIIINNSLDPHYLELGIFSRNPILSLMKYRQFLQNNNIDIVSAFGLRVELFVRLFTNLFKSDVRIISNIRASENWRNFLHVFLDRLTSIKVDRWVSNSISARDTFIKREKIDISKTSIVYNFIEFENSIKYSDQFLSNVNIGILANYKQSKGHFNLPSICRELDKFDFNYTIYCAGHDYTNGELSKMIVENNLQSKIILEGHITDKNKFFNSIDIFFLPSFIEGMSTSMLEAMSFGIPIVASNVDGMPEAIISGDNGFLRNPLDFSGFAKDISEIRNPEIRNKFISKSIEILSIKFDKTNNMKLWENIFLDV
jgi:glycosyltransferase involved in cell wall biosynthesis